MSSSVPEVVYETAIRCAELNGYDSMSGFIKDAILRRSNLPQLLSAWSAVSIKLSNLCDVISPKVFVITSGLGLNLPNSFGEI